MPGRQLSTEQHLFTTWTSGASCCTYFFCTEDTRLPPGTSDVWGWQDRCLWDSSRRRARPACRPVGSRTAGQRPQVLGAELILAQGITKLVVWSWPYMVTCFRGVLSRGRRVFGQPLVCALFGFSVHCWPRACWPPFGKARQAPWDLSLPPQENTAFCYAGWRKLWKTVISFLLNFSDTHWGKGLLKWTKSGGAGWVGGGKGYWVFGQTYEFKREYMDIHIYSYDKVAKTFTHGEVKDLYSYAPKLSYSHVQKKQV